MEKVITTEKIPIKLWLDDIEDGALEQAKNLANLPFVFKHIAIMPDAHQGYGMPIGGVMATKDVVAPNAVGVDIGCGLCAVRTSLTDIDTDTLKKIMGEIRKVVPVGFNKHKVDNIEKGANLINAMNKYMPESTNIGKICFQEQENAIKSLGTLGGGNHFIEIQKGDDGFIWIMIHSGSRNLGLQVANHYNKLAVELNKKWYSQVPKEHQLAFLPLSTEEGQAYIREMEYCVKFALANRELMMRRVCDIFEKETKCECIEPINIAHNYARMENHFGENVMIHRKGATLATEKTVGIIPGSQGSSSYIVKGKGSRESFNSCSHGAGRKMGRKQAIKELSLKEEIEHLDNMGVIHSVRGSKNLDEAPGSYKDIDTVINNQKDLINVSVRLRPLGVIKS